jgi:hypothetical protein
MMPWAPPAGGVLATILRLRTVAAKQSTITTITSLKLNFAMSG